MILDTCFLIDLQREARAGRDGPATAFLRRHSGHTMVLPSAVVMEFEEGFEENELGNARDFLSAFRHAEFALREARTAARIRRMLRQAGNMIGDNDICIAATAVAREAVLVTRDVEHFSRIERLQLDDYSRDSSS